MSAPPLRLASVLLIVAASATASAAQQNQLDNRLRLELIKQLELEAPKVIDALGLTAGMTVADVGAGTGGMSFAMARILGPTSRVYATDINAANVSRIQTEARSRSLDNLTTVLGSPTETTLAAGCCDAIIARDAYHHFTDPVAMSRGFLAALKSGGRLAIIDFEPWRNSEPPAGVPASRTGHGIMPEMVERELIAAGFQHVRTVTKWPPGDASAYMFLMLFRKP